MASGLEAKWIHVNAQKTPLLCSVLIDIMLYLDTVMEQQFLVKESENSWSAGQAVDAIRDMKRGSTNFCNFADCDGGKGGN